MANVLQNEFANKQRTYNIRTLSSERKTKFNLLNFMDIRRINLEYTMKNLR